jgi:hypothetical protein
MFSSICDVDGRAEEGDAEAFGRAVTDAMAGEADAFGSAVAGGGGVWAETPAATTRNADTRPTLTRNIWAEIYD